MCIVAYHCTTGPVSKLNMNVNTVAELFPEYDPESLQRKSNRVDVLPGCDYFGLHPSKKRRQFKCHVRRVWSVSSRSYPDLTERTVHDSNLAKTIHDCIN